MNTSQWNAEITTAVARLMHLRQVSLGTPDATRGVENAILALHELREFAPVIAQMQLEFA